MSINQRALRTILAQLEDASAEYQSHENEPGGAAPSDYERYEDTKLSLLDQLVHELQPAKSGRLLHLTDDQYVTVVSGLGDAWSYRMGEATNMQDPDLEPLDAAALAKLVALPDELAQSNPLPYNFPLDQY